MQHEEQYKVQNSTKEFTFLKNHLLKLYILRRFKNMCCSVNINPFFLNYILQEITWKQLQT